MEQFCKPSAVIEIRSVYAIRDLVMACEIAAETTAETNPVMSRQYAQIGYELALAYGSAQLHPKLDDLRHAPVAGR